MDKRIKWNILLVVDYQKDFVDGALGFEGADKIDEKIAEKVYEYARKGYLVYYTLDTHTSNYLNTREGKLLPVPHCEVNTPGWELYGKTGEALRTVGATEIRKETFGISPYDMTSKFPTSNQVESVEVCGLVTNMCCISCAITAQARYPEAQIILDASLCDTFNKDLHEKTLDVAEGMQIKVINR